MEKPDLSINFNALLRKWMWLIITSATFWSRVSDVRGKVTSCAFMTFLMSPAINRLLLKSFRWNFRWNKREIILVFSHRNTPKSCLFHVFITAPAKKLHHAMDKSHSTKIPLVTRNRSDYRAQILAIFYHFLIASSPQTTSFGQSITFVFSYVLRQWHLHFSPSIGNIFCWISQVCIYFVFIGIISLGASRIFSDQQIQVGFFFFLTVVYNWWISSISWTFVLIPKSMTLHSEQSSNFMLF